MALLEGLRNIIYPPASTEAKLLKIYAAGVYCRAQKLSRPTTVEDYRSSLRIREFREEGEEGLVIEDSLIAIVQEGQVVVIPEGTYCVDRWVRQKALG